MTGTTTMQDRDFIATVISESILEESIQWITVNLEPDDVFDEEALKDWAESNGYVVDPN